MEESPRKVKTSPAEEATLREVFEETGLRAKVETFLGAGSTTLCGEELKESCEIGLEQRDPHHLTWLYQKVKN